jgi:serine beta-lactamase-like protein LACTB
MGLNDTVADENAKIIEHRSRWYSLDGDGTFPNSEYADLSYKWAGGGLLSTPSDLVRFGSALLQPGFLKASSLQLLFTSQHSKAGTETHYGIGWMTYEKGRFGPERTYAHSGGSVGGTSWLIIYPDQNVVAAITVNTRSLGPSRADIRKIAEPFLNLKESSTVK